MLRQTAALLACSALVACGSDSTGPGDRPVDVSGSWSYESPNMAGTLSGQTVTCSIFGTSLTLTQSGTSFSGQAQGGNLVCQSGGQSSGGPMGSGPVTSGTLVGNEITFDFGSPDWRHTGSVAGNSMSGTMRVVINLDDQTVVLDGNWSAQRSAGSAALTAVPGLSHHDILRRLHDLIRP